MSFTIIPYNNIYPNIDQEAYIADNSCIIGAVTIGSKTSVWYNCVIRGDVAPVTIGAETNIQDGTVIHTSRFNGPVLIGDNVTVGHCCLIHGCTIASNAFIGMRATIMDHAIIEEYGFVAAGSLVLSNSIIKSKELWIGSPAKFVRYLTNKELDAMLDNTANYIQLTNHYLHNTTQ